MSGLQAWYIIKQNDGSCDISDRQPSEADEERPEKENQEKKIWGPFDDRKDAIARRIGLIRAGKCQPKQS
ncbi:MAG: DDE transposase family protein [Cyanobacteria bacterium SBLK]|nr:DDE transposase family protein [Cyanobacteria bacterium SBLK]